MPIMTLPVWVFILSVGTPIICLLMLVTGLLRRKRKERPWIGAASSAPAVQHFGRHIHHQVLVQQIDAIFKALVTVIEAERIKLNALVMHAALPEGTGPSVHSVKEAAGDAAISESADDTGRTAAAMALDGMSAEQIARVLGLSHSEVALALKVRGAGIRRGLDTTA